MSTLPSLDELATLPPTLNLVAPPEFEDFNGHVNVSHHYALHMQACHAEMMELGIDERSLEAGFSIFSAEHHLTFHNEIRVGDRIEGRCLLLGRNDKIIHGISVLTDVTTSSIASLCEWVEIAIDMNERRSTPFPEPIAAALDARIAEHAALGWSLPLAGPMGPR